MSHSRKSTEREWLISQPGVAVSLPHEDILLRWTAAIKEKTEKLIGVPDLLPVISYTVQ